MFSLLVFIRKDLRLLARDRAALMFILVAPLMVISVAGFSLANLYGADPTGQTAYDLPFVDEDGSRLAHDLRERLEHEPAVRVRAVRDRAVAEALVRDKQAGTAVVIPGGTAAALAAGQSARIIVYTDPVKYLERINVRTRLLELRDALAADQAAALQREAGSAHTRMDEQLATLKARLATQRATLEAAWRDAQRARAAVVERIRRQVAQSRAAAAQAVRGAVQQHANRLQNAAARQVKQLREEFQRYNDRLMATRTAFETWLDDLKRRAGSHAADIPPPPPFPELPPALKQAIDNGLTPMELTLPDLGGAVPEVVVPELPSLPDLPALELPEISLPALPAAPPLLDVDVVSLTGGPTHINTFDQNVPGFAVTFLMLGMLLGISLGLLDEREWGTLDRMRALPVGASHFMLAKLLARFLVGVVQMILLLSVGWLAFGVSLGPQPAALLLPICGIAFAGTAFGLIVAAVARSREAVFSVGSAVMVTMAAVGGCWWPIDLEPRWMRRVALAFPTTWAMDAFNDLMIRRRSVEAAVVPTTVMLAYGLAYLMLGLAIFRRRS